MGTFNIGKFEVTHYSGSKRLSITKHYNDAVHKTIDMLSEEEIYQLEFIISDAKRKLDLK